MMLATGLHIVSTGGALDERSAAPATLEKTVTLSAAMRR